MPKFNIVKNPLEEKSTPLGLLAAGEYFGLTPENRVGNLYVLGRGGQGKSITLANLVISDIYNGRGGMFIDPFGDLIEEILKYVPKERKDKVVVARVKKGDAKANLAKLNKEIDWKNFKKDPEMFVLCDLHFPTIGAHEAHELGVALLTQFFKMGTTKNSLLGRSLIVDEAYHFLDNDLLKHLLKSRNYGLFGVFSDQSVNYYSEEMAKKLFQATDHLIIHSVESRTARMAIENLKLKLSPEDIRGIDRYRFFARLYLEGKPQPEVSGKVIFPFCYPKTA